MEKTAFLTRSETVEECRTLDNLLYLLSCEWHIPQEKMAGRRSTMLAELRKLGASSLNEAVKTCIAAPHSGDFCPPTSKIVSFAPSVERRIVYCGQDGCIDGFRQVPDYEARRLYKNETAMAYRKCGCARLA